jgi:NADH:ubiquinone oxidoreductase subunit 2 (subunit N)
MYMKEPGESVENIPPPGFGLKVAVIASAVGTLVLGVFPSVILDYASRTVLK